MGNKSVLVLGNRRLGGDLTGLYETVLKSPAIDVSKTSLFNVDRTGVIKSFSTVSDTGIFTEKNDWRALGYRGSKEIVFQDIGNNRLFKKQFYQKNNPPDILIYVMSFEDLSDYDSIGGVFHQLSQIISPKLSTIIIDIPTVSGAKISSFSSAKDFHIERTRELGNILPFDSLSNKSIGDLQRIFVDFKHLNIDSIRAVDDNGLFRNDADGITGRNRVREDLFPKITQILNIIEAAKPSPAVSTTSSSQTTPPAASLLDKISNALSTLSLDVANSYTVPVPPTETDEEKRLREQKIITAGKIRINEQACLMINSPTLLHTKPFAGFSDSGVGQQLKEVPSGRTYANFATYRNGANGTGGHIDLTKHITKSEEHRYFLKEIPPHILSALTPSIKIYKVFYPEKNMFSPNSEGFSWRVPFDEISVPYKTKAGSNGIVLTSQILSENYSNDDGGKKDSLDSILNGDSRLHGVGIKSFRYAFKGTNPAEVNTNIEADLELYLQDVRDIVKEYEVLPSDSNFSNVEPNKIKNNLKFSYSDLIADVPAKINMNKKEKYNTDYYRIKIAVGYSIPPDDYLLKLVNGDEAEKRKIKDAIRKAAVFLYLNPYNHDISFEENGAITLKIQYIAAMTVQTSVINCMEIAENSYSKLLEAQKTLDQKLRDVKNQIKNLKTCSGLTEKESATAAKGLTDELEPQVEKLKTELELSKNSVYTEIFSRLTGVWKGNSATDSARSRVYEVVLNSDALGLTEKGELNQQSQSYENLSRLKKVHGYFLSEISERDSSWYLTQQPILPKEVNTRRESSPTQKPPAAPVVTPPVVATPSPPPTAQSMPISTAVKQASSAELQKIPLERGKQIQVKLNEIAVKEKIKFRKLPITGKLLDKTVNLAKRLNITITTSGDLYKNVQPNTSSPTISQPEKIELDQQQTAEAQTPPATPQKKPSELAVELLTKSDSIPAVKVPLSGPYEGKFSVKFIFLGDIIDVFCQVLNKIEFDQDRPKMILNNFQLEIPIEFKNNRIIYGKETYNISDIPVSLEMLKTFLMERMIKPRASSYNLFSMITHLVNDIIPPSISPKYFGSKSVLNRSIRVGMLGMSIPKMNGREAILGLPPGEKKFSGRIEAKELKGRNIHESITIDNSQNLNNYTILYCSNQLPNIIKNNNGATENDERDGIYHFYIGSDRGIIRKINFSRTDTPFYKEAKAQSSQGIKSLGRLQEVYNVSVTMFGNNIYKPGDFFYVEPLFFSGRTAVDLSNKIGLGGYYQVIDVETKIGIGVYETSLRAVLYGRLTQEGEVVSEVEERACGNIREYQNS